MNASLESTIECPLCKAKSGSRLYDSAMVVDCECCGRFSIIEDLIDLKIDNLFKPHELSLISHIVGRNKKSWDRNFLITEEWINKTLKSNNLPKPKELLDNLIYWIGSQLNGLGEKLKIDGAFDRMRVEIGAINKDGLFLILGEAYSQGYTNQAINITPCFEGNAISVPNDGIELTYQGWEYFESIKRGGIDTKTAFMAMPFNNPDLDNIFSKYWKDAADKAGYTLERLDERQSAGSIDDRLRQTIRRSAFLICELTNANLGAYWEAGFAEGHGIPVIYTCKDDYTDDKKPHFDVNHHLCVFWNDSNIESKAEELTAIIKETFIIA